MPATVRGQVYILRMLAALAAGDAERAFLLRTEVRELLVDPQADGCCRTCLEPRSVYLGRCGWCNAWD